ncbi:MAG: T9SS type A sorting domain-containing protein [Bacteroidota bacterium]
MYYRGNIILFLWATVVCSSFGQSVSHQVLAPWSNVADISDKSINQTVGESIVEILNGNNYFLTQGFNQPSVRMSVPRDGEAKGIAAYPNPVIDILNVELSGYEMTDFELLLFGLNGTMYHRLEVSCGRDAWNKASINLGNYKRGMYFLRVRSLDNRVSRLFKIEKM